MQSIRDFIGKQSRITVDKMYGSLDPECKYSPWACKAVFSSLSALSKNYVQRLLAIEEPLSSSSLEKWVKPEHKNAHQKTIDDLIRLWVLVMHRSSEEVEEEEAEEEDETNDKTTKLLVLNPYFRKGLQHALCHPEEPWSTSAVAIGLKPDKKVPSLEFLDEICAEKWNYVLRTQGDSSGSYYREFYVAITNAYTLG